MRADQPDMNLPEGMTCADCFHHPRCVALFGCIPTNTHCDWSPSKFSRKIILNPHAAWPFPTRRDAAEQPSKERP